MPRPKKAMKIVDKIIGKPDNRQGAARVVINPARIDENINTTIDSMFNHPI